MIRRVKTMNPSTTAAATGRPAVELSTGPLARVRGGTVYQKIEWTWNDGGVTAGDDWEART